MNFRNYVYMAIRRSEPAPQSIVGIIWHVGQETGVRSEADQDKLPTQAELSDSLQALIDTGRIVEVCHLTGTAKPRTGRSRGTSREFPAANMRRHARLTSNGFFGIERKGGNSM